MPNYNYLIIGGGMTAAAAARGIREVDSAGSIGLISAESQPPYDRPPLTKGLWKGQALDQIWRELDDFEVTLHLGEIVQPLDVEQKRVLTQLPDEERRGSNDTSDTIYTYDKLLLATGGTPRRLPVDGDHIIYYRTLAHYERLRSLTEQTKQRFAVIGAGFIGSEIAAALTMNDQEVVLIFPQAGIGGHMFPPDLANFLNDYYREQGVEVVPDERIADVEQDEDGLILKTQSGREIRADHAVAGLGIDPNIELAQRAGLEVGDGIIVDSFLRTSDPNVYAAGDVASFYNATLDTRLRVEHEDNANTMGRLAGRAMAGEPEPYNYLPYFYSDLFELGYEAVGELKSDLELVTDWQEACRQGVVYYLQRGRVRGVLLWNVWDQLDAARELIAAPGPFKPNDLKGRLPA